MRDHRLRPPNKRHLEVTVFRVLEILLGLMPGFRYCTAALPPPPDGFAWVRNEALPDEFNGFSLDTGKCFDHSPIWQGRPPARFLPSAVSVSNGCLQIQNVLRC